jgi:hypothetical protein
MSAVVMSRQAGRCGAPMTLIQAIIDSKTMAMTSTASIAGGATMNASRQGIAMTRSDEHPPSSIEHRSRS